MRAGFPLVLFLALSTACGGGGSNSGSRSTRYGGVFNLNQTDPLRSIFPLTLTEASSFRIMAQVYQGLVALDPVDLSIRPCLAETWEVDPSATQYTFHLRAGVYFHDDAAFPEGHGREVMADDVVRCFTAICTQGLGDGMFWLFQDRILGANEFYEASVGGKVPEQGVKGIEKIDDRTLRLTLTHPTPNFLQIIAHQGCWIWPQELTKAYGDDPRTKAIGTGPFRLRDYEPTQVLVLERSARYWGRSESGDALPYLDGVRMTFADNKRTEFEEFLKGHVTALLELPVDNLADLGDSVDASGHQRFTLRTRAALASQFYGLDAFHAPFSDVRVRKAFALAIDRSFIVDSVLGGLATPAEHGIVAPGLTGYPYTHVPGVPFAPDSARALLAAAGYPGGKGFPALQLQVNADGFGYLRVAEAVQTMLGRELSIPISLSVLRADRHYDRVERGLARFWREGWTADHPDPENFLALLYGKNAVHDTAVPASINKTRYDSELFNEHFAKAALSKDNTERMNELAECDRLAMMDMPLIPLYHRRAAYLLQPKVRDLHLNAIEYLDLTAVWLEKGAPAP
jgi:oligopeptide transport system substrate-binding protein